MQAALAALLLLAGTACRAEAPAALEGDGPRVYRTPFDVAGKQKELQWIRGLAVTLEPALRSAQNDFERAVILRNHIYSRVSSERDDTTPPFSRFFEVYQSSVLPPYHGHYCGGRSLLYQMTLAAFAIPSRYVGFFPDANEPEDSHATVEVYLDGSWVASDPTFNVMFQSGDRYLNYLEVIAAARRGYAFEVTSNGHPLRDHYPRFETYPTPFLKLSRFAVFSEARTLVNGEIVVHPARQWPDEWGGTLVVNGKPVSALVSSASVRYHLANDFVGP